ncbi:DUF2125 domain-containing protein [Roseovarius pelagicus]|uniref:DUF2125 domain-containing protein n=1 Tax=Roseovarius pelagicus TaxID=2980108 RepID=A0ABY6D8Y9_9RHOB|nr:DUF2125 domain-containing protein [Roseovarius pelagicus]UXX82596.1 DUF2125 domain-containing protein [Roseovarius pelagicus]
MRALLGIIILASLGWGGYWFIGAGTAKSGFDAWFDARRAEGWVAEYADLDLRGFPNRFDASFTDVALADPGTGLAWEAPFFQLLALSYKPNHVIAVWPSEQLIATPLEKYRLTSDDMRASLVLEPSTGLTLDRATLTAQHLTVVPEGNNAPLTVDGLTLAAERVPADADAHYHLGLRADDLVPSATWAARVDPNGTLPDILTVLHADLTIRFDKPWDRSAIEAARPQPQQIRLRLAEATWGQLSLQAAGEVAVDAAGVPTGAVTIKARNWRDILELARRSGAVPAQVADPLEDGLTLLSRLAGNPKTLDIPLEFAKGRVWLGPVPIAKAPVLRLR